MYQSIKAPFLQGVDSYLRFHQQVINFSCDNDIYAGEHMFGLKCTRTSGKNFVVSLLIDSLLCYSIQVLFLEVIAVEVSEIRILCANMFCHALISWSCQMRCQNCGSMFFCHIAIWVLHMEHIALVPFRRVIESLFCVSATVF